MDSDGKTYDNRTERLTLTDRELTKLLEEYIHTGAVLAISAVFEAALIIWCLDLMNSD
jgi:hypothetical protein|tara:strand:+ start:3799 stop:3972 length:174 start_codon:yes stop_codon:yes gene_type:complete